MDIWNSHDIHPRLGMLLFYAHFILQKTATYIKLIKVYYFRRLFFSKTCIGILLIKSLIILMTYQVTCGFKEQKYFL